MKTGAEVPLLPSALVQKADPAPFTGSAFVYEL